MRSRRRHPRQDLDERIAGSDASHAPMSCDCRLDAEHAGDCLRVSKPDFGFIPEMFAARRRDRVEPRAPIVLRKSPLGLDEPAVLESAQRRIERALLYAQYVASGLLDPARYGVSVRRSEEERFEDEDAERSLKQ